jgi:hypothetical protein
MFSRDKYAKHYIDRLNGRQQQYISAQETLLMSELESDGEALQQLTRLKKKIETFELVLSSKFLPEEMVYKRYMGQAEMVHQACIENFKNTVLIMKTNSAIDYEGLQKQALTEQLQPVQLTEIQSRMQIYTRGELEILHAAELNEKALTGLDSAMEQIRNVSSEDVIDVDDAMLDMKEMTDVINEFQSTVLQ